MEPTVRTVALPRTRMQITELGEGLPVIMCHGFPGLGYSWRHQMHAVAEAGFRSVAPDMLGYGGTDAPADPSEYTHRRITDDLVALVDRHAITRRCGPVGVPNHRPVPLLALRLLLRQSRCWHRLLRQLCQCPLQRRSPAWGESIIASSWGLSC